MLNHITIMGRLTKDVELRRTGSGTAVSNFTLACERDFGQGGQKETDFVECVAWGKTGEFAEMYFSKGKMAVVSGRLQLRALPVADADARRIRRLRRRFDRQA